MIVKKMNLDDLNSIANNLEDDYDNFWNYNILKHDFENDYSYYICAKLDNTIIGFGGIWTIVDVAHISNIVVKKDMRRKGIGSKILQELINISTNNSVKEITLEVNENNTAAISLYKKYGFERAGYRKNYYAGTESAIILTKNII